MSDELGDGGRTLLIKLINIGSPDKAGRRVITYELNGLSREATVLNATRSKSARQSPA